MLSLAYNMFTKIPKLKIEPRLDGKESFQSYKPLDIFIVFLECILKKSQTFDNKSMENFTAYKELS